MTVDETPGTGNPTPGPGWLDDPFQRSGQRWWDGQQWTARTRSVNGDPTVRRRSGAERAHRSAQQHPSARERTTSAGPPPRGRSPLRAYAPVIVGVFLAFAIVGLVAPSAEESGVATTGYPRAAYWSCADLLTQRLGPAVDLEFPGDSTATITHDGPTWDVIGTVEIVDDQETVVRDWRCTVGLGDDGVWRGTATLDG
jgi:hypothetical protein